MRTRLAKEPADPARIHLLFEMFIIPVAGLCIEPGLPGFIGKEHPAGECMDRAGIHAVRALPVRGDATRKKHYKPSRKQVA